jgi:hypothetical protein
MQNGTLDDVDKGSGFVVCCKKPTLESKQHVARQNYLGTKKVSGGSDAGRHRNQFLTLAYAVLHRRIR